MVNRDIYNAALSLAGETQEADRNTDYLSRAPHLLAAACAHCAMLDANWRQAHNLPAQELPADTAYALTDPFPLTDPFASPAALLLAAALVNTENSRLEERLRSEADRILNALSRSLPFVCEKIAEKY